MLPWLHPSRRHHQQGLLPCTAAAGRVITWPRLASSAAAIALGGFGGRLRTRRARAKAHEDVEQAGFHGRRRAAPIGGDRRGPGAGHGILAALDWASRVAVACTRALAACRCDSQSVRLRRERHPDSRSGAAPRWPQVNPDRRSPDNERTPRRSATVDSNPRWAPGYGGEGRSLEALADHDDVGGAPARSSPGSSTRPPNRGQYRVS